MNVYRKNANDIFVGKVIFFNHPLSLCLTLSISLCVCVSLCWFIYVESVLKCSLAHRTYRCLVCEYTYVFVRIGIVDDFAGAMCVCGFIIYSRCICCHHTTKRTEGNAIHSRAAPAHSTNQYIAINYWYIHVMIWRCMFAVGYIFFSRLVRSVFHEFCILGYLFNVFSFAFLVWSIFRCWLQIFFGFFFEFVFRFFFSPWPMHWVHWGKFRFFHVGKPPIIIYMKN